MEMQRMSNFQTDKLAKVEAALRDLERRFPREMDAIAARFVEPIAVLAE